MPAYFKNRRLRGSVGNDLQSRFMTPYDVDWGFLVNFNHDFMGKAALEKIAQNPPRKIVKLEWNAEDVGSAYRSEERRVGKACVSTCRSRWAPCHYTKQTLDITVLHSKYH